MNPKSVNFEYNWIIYLIAFILGKQLAIPVKEINSYDLHHEYY